MSELRDLNQVYLEDCKVIAKELKGQVDLVYADIIYGAFDEVCLLELCESLRPGGAFFLQTDYRSVAEAKIALDKILHFVNWIIWPYDWGGRPKDAFGRKHDDILYYHMSGGERTFNAEAVSIPKTVMMRSEKTMKIPTDVWSDIGNFYTTSKERVKVDGKNVHWQKPERLMDRIILSASNPGDLIFEPYLGTGTACVAAKRLGRRFIGSDIDPQMVKIAKKRLK